MLLNDEPVIDEDYESNDEGSAYHLEDNIPCGAHPKRYNIINHIDFDKFLETRVFHIHKS